MSDTEMAYRATLDGSGFNSGLSGMHTSLTNFNGSLGTATGGLSGLAGSLGMVASPAGLAGAGLMAVGAGLASAVSVAGNFEQKMAGVNAIVGGSAADMQTLSNAAREAGASTSFSASQAADALGYMAGAGWDVQSSTTALKDTLTLAAAGGMDLAAAGDLMTGTVAQFGLKAEDAGRVANVLAAGASATNTSVSQLGAGMTVVGSTANAFGMSLESTTAALGTLSNANIKGAEGGTALRGILASLASQSGTATAALAELGVTNEQINPEFVSLSDAMQLLQDRGMTATQAIQIFGRENVSAATYMAAHASELDGLETSITGTGKASEMAATMTDTYQGAMGELSSAVEEAEIALGSVLLPVVTQTIDLMAAGVTAATDFGKGIYEAFQPEGSVGSIFAESDAWLADTFGFPTGEAAGESMASGIESKSPEVAESIEKATGGEDAKAAVKASADELAKEFVKQYGSQFEAGMTLINGVWTSQAAAVADKISEQTVYLKDQEYVLRSINSGENMIYQIREKSTGELIKATQQLRQTNDLLTSEAWAAAEGYDTRLRRTITFDVLFDSATALKTKMEEIGEQAAGAFKDGIVTASEQETLTALVAEYTAMGGDASNALIAAILKNDWYGVGQQIGAKTASGLVDSLTGTKYSVGETRTLQEIITEGGKGIADLESWRKTEFLPALEKSFSEMHTIQDRGYEADKAQTEEWIEDKIKLMDDYGDWFDADQIELLSKWENTKITTKQFYDEWAALTKEGTETVSQSVAGSGLYYGDFASETDTWQNYALEGGGYIGPTEHYDEYMAQVEKQISGAEEAMQNIKKMDLEIDTTLAVADTQALIDEINVSNPVMSIMLDTTVADAQFQNLYRLITEAQPVMQVAVAVSADAYQIRAEVRAAIAEAIQNA